MSPTNSPPQPPTPVVAFVLEQTLGHVTHSANIERLAPSHESAHRLTIEVLRVPFEPGRFGRVPGWSNWTIRAAVRAHRVLRAAVRRQHRPFDAMFVHTQVPATLLKRRMAQTPTVVSLDATPLQYDDLGEYYQHSPGHQRVESVKHRLHRACFERASHLVTWSSWARDDLVDRYGIESEQISVIPPGVDVDRWTPNTDQRPTGAPLEVLFVGGDLQRKGGRLLIDACRQLRDDTAVPLFELHIVTNAEVDSEPGITIHRGLTPNSAGLIERFRSADVFCLPTFGDCLPMVLAEAGACGLPLLATDVGAISEIVRDGSNGALIAPGDSGALQDRLRELLCDPAMRAAYGKRSRELVVAEHNARINVGRIVELVGGAARRPASTGNTDAEIAGGGERG